MGFLCQGGSSGLRAPIASFITGRPQVVITTLEITNIVNNIADMLIAKIVYATQPCLKEGQTHILYASFNLFQVRLLFDPALTEDQIA
ncbi:MAG: hypothetical protein ACFFC7_15360 [Candidatus Hermodarchaeota archaeon]